MLRWKLKWPWSKNPIAFKHLKNMFLVSTGHTGASAIVPIISDVVSKRDISTKYSLNQTAELIADPQPQPFFHWTHDGYRFLKDHFETGNMNIVFLHRDPRDVAVSVISDKLRDWAKAGTANKLVAAHIGPMPSIEPVASNPEKAITRELQLRALKFFIDTPECYVNIERACEWLRLARERPIKVVRFDEVKENTVKVALDILGYYGLPETDDLAAEVQVLYDEKYSFEAMVGRPRGSVGEMHRDSLMVRKGISGEWRQIFDDELVRLYDAKYGKDIEFLGYDPSYARAGRS